MNNKNIYLKEIPINIYNQIERHCNEKSISKKEFILEAIELKLKCDDIEFLKMFAKPIYNTINSIIEDFAEKMDQKNYLIALALEYALQDENNIFRKNLRDILESSIEIIERKK